MSSSPIQNLEYLAARHAQELLAKKHKDIDINENTITKTLGVLQENGVYACFLYLLAREKQAGEVVVKEMRQMLEAVGVDNSPANDLDYAQILTESLPTLLLAKEALEQMLIFARYGAKAAGKT